MSRTTSTTFNVYKPNFMSQGACIGYPTRWWFPEHGDEKEQQDQLKTAKEICNNCPVRLQCYEFGSRTGSAGVWGGVTLDRGKPTRRGKNRAKAR
jgi:WhiB family redox-sensing transcriptional regulator